MQKIEMRVFKYFEEKFRENFAKGNFYINTFSEIRKTEFGQIGDKAEASFINKMEYFKAENTSLPEVQKEVEFIASSGILLVNCEAEIVDLHSIKQLPNAFMYCVAKERNDDYWITQDRPACIEISDFNLLSSLIQERLTIETQTISDDCFFESPVAFWDEEKKDPNYFRKSTDHIPQTEYRSVFRPVDESLTLQPQIVNIGDDAKKLIKFLK